MHTSELKNFLTQLKRAVIALFIIFQVLLGSFWPLFAIAQTDISSTRKENESENNKITCSIQEKYTIVYSYNTVLGEEPDLKVVNLLCIALKKKKRAVVFESVVNYLKSILEKNDNLRLKAGINAFQSIFGDNPDEEQIKLLNQIVFEGPIYSYSELKVLIDLNKDRFIEVAKKKERDYEIVEKETGERIKVEKHIKALTQDSLGRIINSGFCTSLDKKAISLGEVALNGQRDSSLAFLENQVDVDAGHGVITFDTTDIGSTDENTITAVAKLRGLNQLTLIQGAMETGANIQNVADGTQSSNPFINSSLFSKQKVQATKLNIFSARLLDSSNVPIGKIAQVDGTSVTHQNINITGTPDIQLNNPKNVITFHPLPDDENKLIGFIRAKDNTNQDITALGVANNTSGTYSISLTNQNLFNITGRTNSSVSQVLVHNFIDLPSKTIRTEAKANEQFKNTLIGTLGYIHDRTDNLQKIGELSASSDLNAFQGFTIFDFDKSTDMFQMAYHFYGTGISSTNSPNVIRKSLLSLNPQGANGPFKGDEYIAGIKTVVDPVNPDDHYLLISYYRQNTSSGTLMFTPPQVGGGSTSGSIGFFENNINKFRLAGYSESTQHSALSSHLPALSSQLPAPSSSAKGRTRLGGQLSALPPKDGPAWAGSSQLSALTSHLSPLTSHLIIFRRCFL